MKTFIRKTHRQLLCSAAYLYQLICKPLFYFCFLSATAPAILLAILLGWKAAFFPASMPQLLWILFLPLWLLFSCVMPALCASAVLAMPPGISGRCASQLTPIFTLQILLAFAWALFLLYRFPPLFCMLSAAVCAIAALLCVRYCARLGAFAACSMLCVGLWNVLLVFLCARF